MLERHLRWIQDQVQRRLGPILRKKAEPCDYVQDAIIQFLKLGPRFIISDGNHLRALLLRIIENTLRGKYDWYMAQCREVARERPLPSSTVLNLDPSYRSENTAGKSVERHEREAFVRLGMWLLKPEDSEVLILRYWKSLSFISIGERLGISSDAARMRHNRAIDRLAEEIGALRRGKLSSLGNNNLL